MTRLAPPDPDRLRGAFLGLAVSDALGTTLEFTPLHPCIDEVAAGSYLRKQPPEIRGGGYVVASLAAALWTFATTTDDRGAVLAAANPGDDADTTAAVAGQVTGAQYGARAIPSTWREALALRSRLERLAEDLVTMASPHGHD